MKYLILLSLLGLSSAIKEDDLVTNLPGLTFVPNFQTYSGYLNANANGTWQMHYTLTTSRSNPSTDPVLIWFNGGPGCSSFAGLFEELGPFQVNPDGGSLYENPYSWNERANVLYLESPVGVGFSYSTTEEAFSRADDMQTLQQNLAAISDFFARVQPQYKNRQFFLSGESYAGIYIPMLSKFIVQGINDNTFPNPNFQGAAIGNGFMNVKYLLNSLVLWSAYHGRISVQNWNQIKEQCATPNVAKYDVDNYDFTKYMMSPTGNGIDFVGDNSTCGKLINDLITMPDNMFPYNYYQDCYLSVTIDSPALPPKASFFDQPKSSFSGFQHKAFRSVGAELDAKPQAPYLTPQQMSSNTANLINRISTDNQWGYSCWNEDGMSAYANRRDVQDALHIPQAWRAQQSGKFQWTDCNDAIYDNYKITYNTTNEFFDYVFQNVKTPNFRFLIYNGDVDTVCNYLGDAWHIKDVADKNNLVTGNRIAWYFSPNNQVAGFYQRYAGKSGQQSAVTVDLLTVKGAGHMVPTDRPGPAAQMITSFMFPSQTGAVDYSDNSHTIDMPALQPFQTANSNGSIPPPAPTSTPGGNKSASQYGLLGFFVALILYRL